MEEPHAVIAMSEYLGMLKFVEAVKANKIPHGFYTDSFNSAVPVYTFYSQDETLNILSNELESEHKTNERLRTQLHDAKKENEILKQFEPKPKEVVKPKQITMDDIRKMSIWKFRKWRKS